MDLMKHLIFFDEIDNNCNKRNEYKPLTSKNINKKINCWSI